MHNNKQAPGSYTCALVPVSVRPVYLDHLHVLAPSQVDSEQRVLLVPSVADHRHGGYSPPHEAAAVNLMSDHINMCREC